MSHRNLLAPIAVLLAFSPIAAQQPGVIAVDPYASVGVDAPWPWIGGAMVIPGAETLRDRRLSPRRCLGRRQIRSGGMGRGIERIPGGSGFGQFRRPEMDAFLGAGRGVEARPMDREQLDRGGR